MILEEMKQKFNTINQFCWTNIPLYFLQDQQSQPITQKGIRTNLENNDIDFDDLDISHLEEI
jgi:hypothetical protein